MARQSYHLREPPAHARHAVDFHDIYAAATLPNNAAPRAAYSSPSWLAVLRFTSVEEHAARGAAPQWSAGARYRCIYSSDEIVRSLS